MVAGDDSGAVRTYSVSVEGEYYMSHEFTAHSKGVNAVLALGDGTVITGGDKDRRLLTWDSAREFDKRLDIKLPDGVGNARSLTKQSIDQVFPRYVTPLIPDKTQFFSEWSRYGYIYWNDQKLHFGRFRKQKDIQDRRVGTLWKIRGHCQSS